MPDMLIAPAVAPRITRPMIATAIAGGIAVAGDVVLFAANQDVGAIDIVLQAVVGAVWIVAGMTAWIRYPTLRTGALMIAVGVLWLSTQLYAWEGSIAVTLVRPLDNLGVAVALHLFVAFPSGRLRDRGQRLLVAVGYADGLLIGGLLPQLLLRSADLGCSECGTNLLLVHRSIAVGNSLRGIAGAVGIAICAGVAWLLVRRWRAASPAGRAVLGPVLWAGAIALTANVALIAVNVMSSDVDLLAFMGTWIASITWALVPLAFLLGLLRARLRRVAVTRLMVDLGELPPPGARRSVAPAPVLGRGRRTVRGRRRPHDAGVIRHGLARLLDDEGFEVVAEVGDADALLRHVEADPPDVVVVDIRMPPSFTSERLVVADAIRESRPDVGVLLLSQHTDVAYAMRLLDRRAGHVGYLLKDRIADVGTLAQALRRVHAGETVVDPDLVRDLLETPRLTDPLGALTAREREVLALIAEGLTDRGIAAALVVAPKTVEAHVRSIFRKLDLPSAQTENRRVHAVLAFLQR